MMARSILAFLPNHGLLVKTQGTSMKTDHGPDVLDAEEHVHIANNNAAGKTNKQTNMDLCGGNHIAIVGIKEV